MASSSFGPLSPQAFGIRDNKYQFGEYKKIVLDSILKRKDLNEPVKAYLYSLFDYYSGENTTRSQLKNVYNKTKLDLPIYAINTQFSTIVGPVACIAKGLLRSDGVNLNNSAKVYIPTRPVNPMMDYGLYQGEKQFVISSNPGKAINVSTPSDILNLLNIDPKKVKKWQNTLEWQMLQTLASNIPLVGPIKAVALLYPNLIEPISAAEVTKTFYNPAGFTNFISTNQYLRDRVKPTINEIMYECEKIIMEETRNGKIDLNDIFSSAIQEQTIYVDFNIGPDGAGRWKINASDDVANIQSFRRVYLKSRNAYSKVSYPMIVQI